MTWIVTTGKTVFAGIIAAGLMFPPLPSDLASYGFSGMAFAQDDDDDDDDDDDRGGARSDDRDPPRRVAPRRQVAPVRQAAPVQRAVALPAFAPREIVVTDISAPDLETLLAEGFTLTDQQALEVVAVTLTRLRAPAGTALQAARDRVRQLGSGQAADFNHFYRSEAGESAACTHENCASLALIDWPQDRTTCQVSLPVGVIDTGVNAEHAILQGARLTVERLADDSLDPSQAVHGTAVVSLLAGAPDSRVPGLIPEAEVLAVDVFSRAGGDERADTVALLRGLDLLASRGVRIINLSLAGPPNAVLGAALDRMTSTAAGPGVLVLAAAGNGGPRAAPSYPAAHPGVMAVTAVDGRARVYRQAQRGEHLDLAAPGVGLLAATSVSGARGKTGTSFAVPFATAAAAVLWSQFPEASAAEVAGRLRAMTRDLGAEGPDAVFGAGILSLSGLCAAGPMAGPDLAPALVKVPLED